MREESQGKQSWHASFGNKLRARSDGQKVKSITVDEAGCNDEENNLEERIENLKDFLGQAEALLESPWLTIPD